MPSIAEDTHDERYKKYIKSIFGESGTTFFGIIICMVGLFLTLIVLCINTLPSLGQNGINIPNNLKNIPLIIG